MGIKGLWTKVTADFERNRTKFEETLHANSVLLVDATGFIFHLLDTQLKTIYSQVLVKREYGGSYQEIEDLLVRETQRLTKKLGFELIFYFDGPDSYYKGNTTAKRREQLLEKWNNMFYAGLGDGVPEQKDLPLPPLSFQSLMTILDRYRIRYVNSDTEADQKMALDCFNLNDSEGEERFYCYTGDSDFLMMKHCKTIRFGDLDNVTKKLSAGLSVPVWKRSSLATAYNVGEMQLVHWAILVGNDFTDHFPKSTLGQSGHQDSSSLLQKFINDEITWDPAGIQDEDCRQAVLYSIAFYELEDLKPFMLEKYKTKNQLDEQNDVDVGLRLPAHIKAALKTWLPTSVKEPKKKNTAVDITRATISFLEILRQEDNKLNATVDILAAEHIDALQKMTLAISAKKFETKFKGTKLQYNDQKIANLYQLIVKEVGKFMQAASDKHVKPFKPSECYDGIIFHNLMNDLLIQNGPESELASKLRGLMLQAPSSAPKAAATAASASLEPAVPTAPAKVVLPTDAYREQILEQIARDRVTIIHGETGCGKSSRVPLFILEEFEAKKKYCKIMITQPRRIAVINLKRRLQEQLGDKIGMRMGHGVREESEDTKIFFVTTGYLVKLLAHHPAALSSITHIIIDEVHERSLDSDLLCWLARQHMAECKDTRLVLMSATLHTSLYATYFHDNKVMKKAPEALSVGLRRFPVDIHYIEDFVQSAELPPKLTALCNQVAGLCVPPKRAGDVVVPIRLAKLQYDTAFALVRAKGKVGAGVLIFVSGIADIVEIQSRFDGLERYELVAIHSEIPFEEQELALTPAAPDKIKVIVATNAAESSVTLPNVDVVICLGTHKAVNYKAGDLLRSTLENIWISKSSAIQRAGRTGRIRPGTVYRLYTKALYDSFVDFEEAEIHRKPLHEIVLSLKATFQDAQDHAGVIPILSAMLEEPDLSKIDECFEYLYEGKMITAPTDAARLTSRGLFAGHMPLDISLSNLIMYGVSLGVGPEAIVAASALAQPKSPFRVAHPIVHTDPMEFNAIVRQTFVGACHFDQGVYSDPVMMIRMMVEWLQTNPLQQFNFCLKHGLVLARMKHFVSFASHVLHQVKQLTAETAVAMGSGGRRRQEYGQDEEEDGMTFSVLNHHMSEAKLNRLRLAMLWALDYNIIHSGGRKEKKRDFDEDLNSLSILRNSTFSRRLVEELFPSETIPHQIDIVGKHLYAIPPPFRQAGDIGQGLRALVKYLLAHDEVYFVSSSFTTGSTGDDLVYEAANGGKKKKNKKDEKAGKGASRTNILFAVRQNQGRCRQFIDLMAKNMKPLTPKWVGDLDSSSVDQEIPALSIFALDNIDNQAHKDFSSTLTHASGLELSVRSDGTAKLLAYDVNITVDTIKTLYSPQDLITLVGEIEDASVPIKSYDQYERISFFDKDSAKFKALAAAATTAPAASTASNKKRTRPARGSGRSSGTGSKTAAVAAVAAEDEVKGDDDDEQKTASTPRRLFEDLPLGMRLFNAYCVGQREKKLKYRQLPETAEEKAKRLAEEGKDSGKEFTHPQRAVPGSAEWLKQKAAEKAAAEEAEALAAAQQQTQPGPMFEAEVLPMKMVVSPWKITAGKWVASRDDDDVEEEGEEDDEYDGTSRLFDLHGKWDNVMMSSRSLVASSCHGPFPHQDSICPNLFGVAYSAITLSNGGGGGGQVMVEGVTIFPVGDEWIRRALFCIGKRLEARADVQLDADEDAEAPFDVSRRAMCTFIRSLVYAGMSRTIAVDELLIQAVDLLFANFITDTQHGEAWNWHDEEAVRRRFLGIVRRFQSQQRRTASSAPQLGARNSYQVSAAGAHTSSARGSSSGGRGSGGGGRGSDDRRVSSARDSAGGRRGAGKKSNQREEIADNHGKTTSRTAGAAAMTRSSHTAAATSSASAPGPEKVAVKKVRAPRPAKSTLKAAAAGGRGKKGEKERAAGGASKKK